MVFYSYKKGVILLTRNFDENFFLINCIRCNQPVEHKSEDDWYCTNCGSKTRNACSTVLENPGQCNEQGEPIYLRPEDCYCPKCGNVSLFQLDRLINCEYPKAEIVPDMAVTDKDLPF